MLVEEYALYTQAMPNVTVSVFKCMNFKDTFLQVPKTKWFMYSTFQTTKYTEKILIIIKKVYKQ